MKLFLSILDPPRFKLKFHSSSKNATAEIELTVNLD